jgi:hypothetical protein
MACTQSDLISFGHTELMLALLLEYFNQHSEHLAHVGSLEPTSSFYRYISKEKRCYRIEGEALI